MTESWLFRAIGFLAVASPSLLLLLLGIPPLLSRKLDETAMAKRTASCVLIGLTACLIILAGMLATGDRTVILDLGDPLTIPEEHFHFHVQFIFDRLSIPFVLLTFILVGAIGSFANRYLHREPGYGRFFLSFSLFLQGMVVAALAGTIETLFFGWELVGLSSALLVAFFHERPAPVLNAQRIWSVYRISDAAFLLAALALHHTYGEGDFHIFLGSGPWPEGQSALNSSQAFWIGLLLLIAAAGKSALLPFSGWLPRAMEGPTPSSAVFYGALSVHLGAYLLLRVSPVLEKSPLLCAIVVAIGLATAAFAALVGRVQSDTKGALAFASLGQVGLITAEIGLGLRYIPLIHIMGHACLRTLQLLRAPSVLQDHRLIENAVGAHLGQPVGIERWLPPRYSRSIYLWALERGQLDSLLDHFVARPFLAFFRWCDRMERKWTNFLSGNGGRESDRVPASVPAGEEP